MPGIDEVSAEMPFGRIQLSRASGWRQPAGTIRVSRPGRWGNLFQVGDPFVPDAATAVRLFAAYLLFEPEFLAAARTGLSDHILGCWCRMDSSCHVDVYLAFTNNHDPIGQALRPWLPDPHDSSFDVCALAHEGALQGCHVALVMDSPTGLLLYATPKSAVSACSRCNGKLALFGRRLRYLRDIPYEGRPVRIVAYIRRFQCQACETLFTQDLPGVSTQKMMTDRLSVWIPGQALNKTFAQLAAESGLTEGAVRSHVYSNSELQSKARVFDAPPCLSISDLNPGPFEVLISDPIRRQIYDLVLRASVEEMVTSLKRLVHPEKVKVILVGLVKDQLTATSTVFPHAVIVVPPWQVLNAVEDVLQRAFVAIRCAGRKPPAPSSADDESDWGRRFPKYGMSLAVRNAFRHAFGLANRSQVETALQQLPRMIDPTVASEWSGLQEILTHWRPHILAWYDTSPEVRSGSDGSMQHTAQAAIAETRRLAMRRLTPRLLRDAVLQGAHSPSICSTPAYR